MCYMGVLYEKIGILTYHTGYNYGASLQAYALQIVYQFYTMPKKSAVAVQRVMLSVRQGLF